MYIHEKIWYLLINMEENSTLLLSDGNVNARRKTLITLLKNLMFHQAIKAEQFQHQPRALP